MAVTGARGKGEVDIVEAGIAELQAAMLAGRLTARELVQAYHRIGEPAVRRRILELIRSLAPESDAGPPVRTPARARATTAGTGDRAPSNASRGLLNGAEAAG